MEDKEEYFEEQIDQIDELSSPSVDIESEPDTPKKPKMTSSETKAAIITAMKKKQITRRRGEQLLWSLGFTTGSKTKKIISPKTKTKKRKQQKAARKVNRK